MLRRSKFRRVGPTDPTVSNRVEGVPVSLEPTPSEELCTDTSGASALPHLASTTFIVRSEDEYRNITGSDQYPGRDLSLSFLSFYRSHGSSSRVNKLLSALLMSD